MSSGTRTRFEDVRTKFDGVRTMFGAVQAVFSVAIREMQKAAKQKYGDGDEAQLGNYYIGERLNQRARLQQIATALAERLSTPTGGGPAADTLPGITASGGLASTCGAPEQAFPSLSHNFFENH